MIKPLGAIRSVFGFKLRDVVHMQSIQRNAGIIQGSADAMLASVRQRRYRIESFEEAVVRLSLDEERLARRRRELLIESRIMYGVALLAFVVLAYSTIGQAWGGVVGAASVFVLTSVAGVTRAFRVHQVDRRELMSFSAYLKDPEGWFK